MDEKHMHNLFLKNMSGLIEETKNPSPCMNPWVSAPSLFVCRTFCFSNSKRGGMATHAGVALELGIVRPQEGKTRYEPRYPLPTTHYRSLIIKPMPLPPENIHIWRCDNMWGRATLFDFHLGFDIWFWFKTYIVPLKRKWRDLSLFFSRICMSPQMEAILIWCQCRTREYEVITSVCTKFYSEES